MALRRKQHNATAEAEAAARNAGGPLAHPVPAMVAEAYRARGWLVTEAGTVGVGERVGPCAAGCGRPLVRYGDRARPVCDACRLARGIPEAQPAIVAEVAALTGLGPTGAVGQGEAGRVAA